MKSRSDELDDILRSQGLRSTSARRSVYVALQSAASPLSAAQIDEALNATGVAIDLVTVYRTLETLERCHLIMRIERMKEGWRYAIRSTEHHHNIVCSVCGSASPLEQCQLSRLERDLEQSTGFSNVRHSLQFFGTCPDCQEPQADTP
ncbi:MAG: transcriptional repressor [Armatimonadetes bacterium]|nr:transcriptional repressor [Armatimonadota bacterium]